MSLAGVAAPLTRSTSADAPDAEVVALRRRIESELVKPAVVLVTSVDEGDGRALTARSLARSFQRSVERAAQLTLDASAAQGASLSLLLAGMRSAYAYTIVDAGPLLSSETAMLLAPLVDGTLLSVRCGRNATDDDDVIVRTIERCGGRVVGVVVVAQDAESEAPEPAAELLARVPAPICAAPIRRALPTKVSNAARPPVRRATPAPVDRAVVHATALVPFRASLAFMLVSGLLILAHAVAQENQRRRFAGERPRLGTSA